MPTSSDTDRSRQPPRRRRALLVVAVVMFAVSVVDLKRPPARRLSTGVAIAVVHVYQVVGHRFFPPGQCRFNPTCSSYAEVVIREHGAIEGGWLTARRLLRCGPWTPEGTTDPPPGD